MILPFPSILDYLPKETGKNNNSKKLIHIEYEIMSIFMERNIVRAFLSRTAFIYVLQPIGIHSYFHNSDSFIYLYERTLYLVYSRPKQTEYRYEIWRVWSLHRCRRLVLSKFVQQTHKWCYHNHIPFFSPSSASQKKDSRYYIFFTLHATLTRKNS